MCLEQRNGQGSANIPHILSHYLWFALHFFFMNSPVHNKTWEEWLHHHLPSAPWASWAAGEGQGHDAPGQAQAAVTLECRPVRVMASHHHWRQEAQLVRGSPRRNISSLCAAAFRGQVSIILSLSLILSKPLLFFKINLFWWLVFHSTLFENHLFFSNFSIFMFRAFTCRSYPENMTIQFCSAAISIEQPLF